MKSIQLRWTSESGTIASLKSPVELGCVDEISTDDVFAIPLRNRA